MPDSAIQAVAEAFDQHDLDENLDCLCGWRYPVDGSYDFPDPSDVHLAEVAVTAAAEWLVTQKVARTNLVSRMDERRIQRRYDVDLLRGKS
jgi:hypothetical protein